MSIANALLSNLAMSLQNAQAQKAQKAEETEESKKAEKSSRQPSFGGLTNVNVNLERTEDVDTIVNNTKEIYKNSLKASAMLYLVGFAIGFCPGLLFAASLAFMFSGKGMDFKSHLVDALSKNSDAMANFQKQNQNNTVEVQAEVADAPAEAPKTPEKAAQAPEKAPQLALETRQQLQLALDYQPRLALEMHDDNKATDPIKAQKEEQLSPLDLAQLKYAKALDNQDKAAAALERREKAQQVAVEKYEEAQARLEKAQVEYDKANAQMKAQMTEKMTKYQQAVVTRFTNANLAKERTDVAKAKLDQAQVNAAIAQKEFEDMQAEDIVDVNI